MKLPKTIDAVDLLYAVDSLCGRQPLRTAGLNRRGLRGAKRAQRWFWNEMVKAIRARKKKAGIK